MKDISKAPYFLSDKLSAPIVDICRKSDYSFPILNRPDLSPATNIPFPA